jgi:hypothetical protein
MSESPHNGTAGELVTLKEIFQQPLLWPMTVACVQAASGRLDLAARLLRTVSC